MEITTIEANKADTRYVETLWYIEVSDDDDANEDLLIETHRYKVRIHSVQHDVALVIRSVWRTCLKVEGVCGLTCCILQAGIKKIKMNLP